MQRPTSVFQTFSAFSLYKGHYQITRPSPSSPKLHDFSEAAPLLSHMAPPHCFRPICSAGSPRFHVLLRREDPKQRLKMPKVKSKLQDVCRLHSMTWKRLQQASRGADWLETNSIPSFLKMTPKERQPQGKREGESVGLHTWAALQAQGQDAYQPPAASWSWLFGIAHPYAFSLPNPMTSWGK